MHHPGHIQEALCEPLCHRGEEASVNRLEPNTTGWHANRQRGFSLIELVIVCAMALTIMAMAILQINSSLNASHADVAARQMIEQIRQAREYSIENRRYVQIQFTTVSSQPEVIITQKNSLTANAGADQVISTIPLEQPLQYCVCSMPDTPDAYGNTAAIYFESTSNGPTGGMLFQSDGELVDGTSYQPINGTVFMGVTGKLAWSRAISVLGTTGRVRAYRSTGSNWVSF
jgi:type II secretory pathway pseudopilin PulG